MGVKITIETSFSPDEIPGKCAYVVFGPEGGKQGIENCVQTLVAENQVLSDEAKHSVELLQWVISELVVFGPLTKERQSG